MSPQALETRTMSRAFTWLFHAALGLSVAASLVTVLSGVIGMEAVYRGGQDFYLRIRPVDPRSLLQGDYIALAYEADVAAADKASDYRFAVLSVDDKGVASFLHHAKDTNALELGQVALPVQSWGQRYLVQPRSFLFEEGQGEALQGAQYAVFRYKDAKGPLLYGLADGDLQFLSHK